MFERYTEEARAALFFARYNVGAFGSAEITLQHLLLGLIRVQSVRKVLETVRLSRTDLAREIAAGIEKRPRIVPNSVEIPFSPECVVVFTNADQEANRLHVPEIRPEHLLLAILREMPARWPQLDEWANAKRTG